MGTEMAKFKLKPQLPEKFVQELLARPGFSDPKSHIFLPEYQSTRFKMVTGSNPTRMDMHADSTLQLRDGDYGFGETSRRNALHLGSVTADPLLTCEIIRMGATIDYQDAQGYTALWLAARSLITVAAMTWKGPADVTPPPRKRPSPQFTKRTVFIMRALTEQHANVNISCEGVTPLSFACLTRSWELITLLLEHGATAPPTFPLFDRTDHLRFNLLVKRFAGKPRPARKCPCWSGEPLSLCHDAEVKPFPLEFICKCGSGKTHIKCCARRKGMRTIEKWDPADGWIAACLPTPVLTEHLPSPTQDGSVLIFQHKLADHLDHEGRIDTAFAYALRQVDFFPR